MPLLLSSIAVLLLSGLGALLAGRHDRRAGIIAVAGVAVASLGAAVVLVPVLLGGTPLFLTIPWNMPLGAVSLRLDAVSALFILTIFALSVAAGLYGIEYLRPYAAVKNIGRTWLLYNVLVVSMVVVCLAANGLLFLLAWETMAISSFFLVGFEHEKVEVRKAAWTYLVATHIGTAFLLPMFILLPGFNGTPDSASAAVVLSPALANVLFVLALVGFGTKAGLMPFHVWLPEAHPAAPSHVSALMSGVMIKTGIYGIVRVLIILGQPPEWWGWTLVAMGAVSGVLGVVFALAQHDIKRLLAYHSVENIGIITMGLGIGLLGRAEGNAFMTILGFGGALLHVVNHALFKGLLFLGAGSIYHATGTREIDRLGGLLKTMPVTAVTFLIGAVAISGLPPLNGFVSEFLLFLASFRGVAVSTSTATVLCLVAVVAGLGVIGPLAAACFTKAFGIPFIGVARTTLEAPAHEAGAAMTVPMIALAAACVIVGANGPLVVGGLAGAVFTATGVESMQPLAEASGYLGYVCAATLVLVMTAIGLVLVRRLLLRRREIRITQTWGCGYPAPTSRMQYTASSFVQPITDLFKFFLGTKRDYRGPREYFPVRASLETHTPDMSTERLYRPLFRVSASLMNRFRIIQHGRTQTYVLYVVLALIGLLIWKLR